MTKNLYIFVLILAFSFSALAEQKRVLIFFTVGGHAAAARAIEEDILSMDPSAVVKMVDVTNISDNIIGKNFASSTLFLMKYAPSVFSELFFKPMVTASRGVETISDRPTLNLVTKSDELSEIIDDFQPTSILSTFIFATESLAFLKEQQRLTTPVGWLHTDLLDDTFFAQVSGTIDMTFLPHPKMTERWIERGIPSDRVASTGIAVRSLFHRLGSSAKEALDSEVPHYILMGGTFGLLDYEGLIETMIHETHRPIKITAICGQNQSMQEKLTDISVRKHRLKGENYLPNNVDLKVLGWVDTNSFQELLEDATAVISKPGGITSFEMIFGRVPSLFLADKEGHEAMNSRFLEAEGLALIAKSVPQIGAIVHQIEKDPSLLANIRSKQSSFIQATDPHLIARWALNPSLPKSGPVTPAKISSEGDTIRSLIPTNNWLCRKAISLGASAH
jgi:processive 1,2-diacylglycerol beta-glucosyltransferase